MADSIVERVRRVLDARAGGSVTGVALANVLASAERGDEKEVATAAAALGERERFLVVVGVGLMFPRALVSATLAADEQLPRGEVFRWTDVCDSALAAQWASAMADHVSDAVIAGLLGRDPHGSRALHAAVVERVGRGRIDGARVLHAAIAVLHKEQRAASRAAIALASGTQALGEAAVTAELELAIGEAASAPIVESGGEEVEALAQVLLVMTRSGRIAPEHPSVGHLVARLLQLRDVQPEQRDQKSWGYHRAAIAAADAATPDRPGWLGVAEKLATQVWASQLQTTVAEHLDAARGRLAGTPTPVPAAANEPAAALPELDALAREPQIERRARDATEVAAARWTAGDVAGTREALVVAIAPPPARLGQAESVRLAMAFAEASVDGGAEAEGLGEVPALVGRWSSTRLDCYTERAVLETVERLLAPKSAARTEVARVVLDAAIPTELVTRYASPWNRGPADARFVAAALGEVLATLGDPAREHLLLAAVAVVLQSEDREGADPSSWRTKRIERTVLALSERLTGAELEGRLTGWRAALGAAASLCAVLAPRFPDWSEAQVIERLGPVSDDNVHDLAAAWARAGRFEDALAQLSSRPPRVRARGLLAMAEVPLDAATRAKLVKAFEKCPKASRDRNDQTTWKHQRAALRLRLGLVDDAIAALAELPDCRVSGFGPAYLAVDIATHLERAGEWTPARAVSLVEALASSGAIAQDLPRPTFTVLGLAWRRGALPAAALTNLRQRLRGADACAVDLAVSVGMARAGDVAGARHALGAALDQLEQVQAHLVRSSLVADAARALADAGSGEAPALLRRALALAARAGNARDGQEELEYVIQTMHDPELAVILSALDSPAMPAALVEPAHDALTIVLAGRLVRHPGALETLATLVEAAPDSVTAERRAGWAAVALARLGRHETARNHRNASRRPRG